MKSAEFTPQQLVDLAKKCGAENAVILPIPQRVDIFINSAWRKFEPHKSWEDLHIAETAACEDPAVTYAYYQALLGIVAQNRREAHNGKHWVLQLAAIRATPVQRTRALLKALGID